MGAIMTEDKHILQNESELHCSKENLPIGMVLLPAQSNSYRQYIGISIPCETLAESDARSCD
jgi:hypothetical protein